MRIAIIYFKDGAIRQTTVHRKVRIIFEIAVEILNLN